MTNESDSFIQEVDEELRRDRALDVAKRYGPFLIGAFVLIVLGIVGWQAFDGHQTRSSRAQADQFAAAVEQAANGDLAGAKTAFQELSADGPRSYRLMARMEHAAVLEAEGDLQAALTEFDAVAGEANDATMRQTAQLRAAYIVADTQDFDAVQTRLQPLIEEGGAMAFLAQELLAVEAWEAGQNDFARETLQNLQLAFDAPETVRRRAELALAVVGPGPAAAESAPPAPSEGENE